MSLDFFSSEESAAAAIAKLRASRAVNAARDWSAPEQPDPPPRPIDFSLKYGSAAELAALGIPAPPPAGAEISLDDFRRHFPQRMEHLMRARHAQRHIDLMKIPPGAGKTHAAVIAAQALARASKRTLWLSPRNDGLPNIAASIEGYDSALWRNWLAMSTIINHETEERACRVFDSAMRVWLDKGYPAGQLCFQLCPTWQSACPFRAQGRAARKSPIVFARHQHLVFGADAGKFDTIIIDESPLGVFIKERIIPAGALRVGSSSPLVVALAQKLAALSEEGKRLAGPKFIAAIEDELDAIYTMADLDAVAMPTIPRVGSAADVLSAEYWYIIDFLRLAEQEFNAHINKWPRWEPRVWLDGGGVHMVDRAEPHEKTPHTIISLDATATPELYSQMFPSAQIETHSPAIARLGKVHQIVNRNNNTTDMSKPVRLADALATVLAIINHWRYPIKEVVIVCHKVARAFWEAAGFRAMHFGALRGNNAFEGAVALFCIGAPSPPADDIRRIASVLSNDIRAVVNARQTVEPRAFALRSSEDIPYRPVSGYWQSAAMSAVHEQSRAAAIRQGGGRIRPLTGGAVWLLSATPAMELDRIYGDPREACGGASAPGWISWPAWVRLAPFVAAQYEAGRAFTVDDLAAALSPDDYERREKIKRNAQNEKWLDKIAAAWGGEVARAVIPNRRGRPPLQVVPKQAKE